MPRVSHTQHDIRLPKGKRRLNIDEASAALAQMGYRLGNIRFDPTVGGSVYKVTQPNGAVSDMTAKQITDMVYKAISAKMGSKASSKKAFGQVGTMLAQIESQAVGQRELAKSNLRKLAEKIADIDHTREEWDRYVNVAKSLGYTESQIAGFSRAGAKAKFEDARLFLRAIQANMWKAERDFALLREKMKQGNWIACSAYCRTLSQIFAAGGGSLEFLFDEYRAAGGRVIPVRNSQEGAKAKFARLSPYIINELSHAEEMATSDGETAVAAACAAVLANPTMENLKAHPLALKELRYKLEIAEDNRDRSAIRSLKKALSARKAKFEKSDEYAAILMKPVTVANCGKMVKVASEAMKYAKSVGDDDLFELAEEVGHECRATKSRASRKDAR